MLCAILIAEIEYSWTNRKGVGFDYENAELNRDSENETRRDADYELKREQFGVKIEFSSRFVM